MEMKKVLLSVVLLGISSYALSAGKDVATVSADTANQVCDGTSAAGKAKVSGGSGVALDATTAVFTKNGFDVQCSANTYVYFNEVSANLAAVAAGSTKGNQAFGGHSNGGAILPGGAADKAGDAKCSDVNDACKPDDVTKSLTNAISAASGSATTP